MSSYSDVIGHGSMLFDHVRNAAYEKAILAAVTKDSVVLDLGAGLGLHGLMAARAGARKVYLVDPSPAVFAAERVAKANGLDNVVCIQSRAEDLHLDEKVDLIISVFTGNFLLTEDLLPSLFLARDKFLKEGGRLIPDRGRMMVQPVSMPDYFDRTVARWSNSTEDSLLERFGIDYSALRKQAENYLYYDDFSEAKWTSLAPEQALTEIDFAHANQAESFDSVECETDLAGALHGWLCWFDMHLGEGANAEWLSTSPEAAKLHWSQVFLPLPAAAKVAKGEKLSLEMKRPEYGDWTWVNQPGSGKAQSTFLSRLMRPADIQKQSPAYKPVVSFDGRILKFVLESFDGVITVDEIVGMLLKTYPERFPDREKAQRYVQLQIQNFSAD